MPTVTIELTDNQIAALTVQAEGRGMTLEAWLQRMIGTRVPPNTVAHLQKTDPERWIRHLEEFVASLPKVPVLSDEAMSRESIYPDRS